MKIFLIGSGNVATQLGLAFKRSGHDIVYVYSPTISHAAMLGEKLNTDWGRSLNAISEFPADIYLIAVKDDAIAEVVKKMPALKKSLIIHTSGATDISVLKKKFRNCGVLWQVQTIKARTLLDFKKVPMVIEANNSSSKKKLTKIARSLSGKVYSLNSKQRRVLHLGAVWVNNFPNHLYYLSEMLLKKHHLPFELFGPLILSTTQSAMKGPYISQTGPAKRNDKKTMNAHLKLLADKNYRTLYKTISKSITNLYN
ncbi:MAG: DUF2520 domain-containing protein [Bacteroidetes bacterium]|nr:MAG: DUF2520 domain-containing protein [Bacteroidota bacterium]